MNAQDASQLGIHEPKTPGQSDPFTASENRMGSPWMGLVGHRFIKLNQWRVAEGTGPPSNLLQVKALILN